MASEAKKIAGKLDLIRGVAVLTLILYIAVALVMNSSYLTVDRLMRLRSDVIYALRNTSQGGTVRLEPVEQPKVALFQDGTAVLTRNGISVYGNDGNLYSTHVLQYKQPRIKVCGQYILCFDRGGTGWTLLNSFRVVAQGTEAGSITNGSLSEDGYVAIAAERAEYKGSVTVYNTDGVALARWNADSYLLDSFFTEKNRLTVVSLVSRKENADTVFTVFNYRKGETERSITSTGMFPLSLAMKQDGSIEILSDRGIHSFDGDAVSLRYSYPDAFPSLCSQGEDATLISFPSGSSGVLVRGLSPEGSVLFSATYPKVLSMGTYRDLFFVLTGDTLFVLDRSGTVLQEIPAEAALQVLVSPEISVLVRSDSFSRLDLSQIG